MQQPSESQAPALQKLEAAVCGPLSVPGSVTLPHGAERQAEEGGRSGQLVLV